MSEKKSVERCVLDNQVRKQKYEEVSLSIFAFLFSEYVQYTQGKVTTLADLEGRLASAGRNGE